MDFIFSTARLYNFTVKRKTKCLAGGGVMCYDERQVDNFNLRRVRNQIAFDNKQGLRRVIDERIIYFDVSLYT